MTEEDLIKTKNKIDLLEEEIKDLEQKKQLLEDIKREYYYDYFDFERENYSLLKNIPENIQKEEHVLRKYSLMDVDAIGKLICKISKLYGIKDLNYKRDYYTETNENKFEVYREEYPILVIGPKNKVNEKHFNKKLFEKDKDIIIIDYNMHIEENDLLMDNPVKWVVGSNHNIKYKTNYNRLVNYFDGLRFDYKNKEFIKELIYSIAYYQRENDIHYMNSNELENVVNKIYSLHK